MIKMNLLVVALTALIPLIIGFIWYSKALFGNAWMKAAGMTEEKIKSGNMVVIFLLTFVFGFMLSSSMTSWCIHQFAVQSLFVTQPGFAEGSGEYYTFFQDFMDKYGDLHRSFGHGFVHGIIGGLFFALPLIAINALFERRGWRYILIHAGYWVITLALICGVLCQFN